MMTEAELLAELLNPARPAAAQSETFDQFFALYEQRAREFGGGRALAVYLARAALRAAAPTKAAQGVLAATLIKVREHRRAARVAERRTMAERLRTLAPWTEVVVRIGGRERVILLRNVKRTRFTACFDDGRLYDVPVHWFVRVGRRASAGSGSNS